MEQCLIDDKELLSEEVSKWELKAKADACWSVIMKLIVACAVCKRKITLLIITAENTEVSKEQFLEEKVFIDGYLNDIKSLDSSQIIEIYSEHDMLVLDQSLLDKEVDTDILSIRHSETHC